MKTAISIPDDVFTAAEKTARRLGMSRSGLYTKAIVEFLRVRDEEAVTQTLNKIYSEESSDLDPVVSQLQALAIGREEW